MAVFSIDGRQTKYVGGFDGSFLLWSNKVKNPIK